MDRSNHILVEVQRHLLCNGLPIPRQQGFRVLFQLETGVRQVIAVAGEQLCDQLGGSLFIL